MSTVLSMPENDLNDLLEAIQNDPADQAGQIRDRTAHFLGAANVSMMGGWT